MSKNSEEKSSKKFAALNDYVTVEPLKEEQKGSKIVVSETVKQRAAKARVVSVGPGRPLADGTVSKPQVEVGDEILLNPHLLQEVRVGQETVYIINATGIYGRYTS